uniref:MULE transposase domain-containing protein n=1 Tax=Lactuca sativa TaxID=4236 RepID=A0A9R1US46_LACSA|nr:hypothetical protein LSAT_V11C800403850 [Lactuca sativa]
MVRELGYKGVQTLYYHFCIPKFPLDYGLLPLGNDQDVLKLVSYVPKHRLVKVYIEIGQTRELEPESVSPELNRKKPCRIEVGSCSKKLELDHPANHVVDQSHVIDMDESQDHSKTIVPYVMSQVSQRSNVINVNEGLIMGHIEEVCKGNLGNLADEPICEDIDGQQSVRLDEFEAFTDDYSTYTDFDVEYNVPNGEDNQVEMEILEGMVSDDSVDAFYSQNEDGFDYSGDDFDDSDYIVHESNLQFDVDVDMSEFQSVVDVDEHGILNKQTESIGNDIVDEELEVIQSDDYQYAGFYEDERTKMLKELSRSNPCSHGEIHLKQYRVGQYLKTKKEVVDYIHAHVVNIRRSLYLAKNDKIRIRIKCGGVVGQSTKTVECGGPSTRSRPNENKDWLVKKVDDVHKFLQTRSVKACTYKYLANLIVPQIQSNPKIPIKALHEELCKKLELGMSVQKFCRAKQMAEHVISGDYQLQYGYLRDYDLELLNTNPGSIIRIDVYPEPCLSTTTRTFRRIYVSLGALKLGFKVGLRDFLGVDGTFLKGPYPGQVLTAVGIDSNNGIYLVTYAMEVVETTSSWTWFMELFGEGLALGANSKFTLTYDRQKGIILAVAHVFPNAEHRNNGKEKELSDLVWECGRATTLNHFKYAMDELKKLNDEDHAWLCKIPVETWSKSHFSGMSFRSCRIFNAKIELGRDKPIITCLEYTTEYLMKRIEIDKCQGELSTTATIILEEINTQAAKFWEITGFPCRHDVSAIWNKIENGEDAPDVEDWVHPCYKLSTWRDMYLNKIDPINGRSMWPKSDCPFTLTPPKHHTQVGRPKKKRRRGVDEPNCQTTKLSRKFLATTCLKCHNKGHNSRTCKGQGGIDEVGSKGKTQGKGKTQAKGKTQGKGKGNLGNYVK